MTDTSLSSASAHGRGQMTSCTGHATARQEPDQRQRGFVTPGHDTMASSSTTVPEDGSPSSTTAVPAVADVTGAARELERHRLDKDTGDCTACGLPCPCPHANTAAAVLARAGLWNQPPLDPAPVAGHACLGRLRRALTRILHQRRRTGP
jgi:hypothetical protein